MIDDPGEESGMALSLIAYFCAMMSALAVFVVLLGSIVPPRQFRQPHPIVFAEGAAALDAKAALPIPTLVQVAADAMTSKTNAGAWSKKSDVTNVARRQTHYQNRLPHRQPDGNLTVLIFPERILRSYRPSQARSTEQLGRGRTRQRLVHFPSSSIIAGSQVRECGFGVAVCSVVTTR